MRHAHALAGQQGVDRLGLLDDGAVVGDVEHGQVGALHLVARLLERADITRAESYRRGHQPHWLVTADEQYDDTQRRQPECGAERVA